MAAELAARAPAGGAAPARRVRLRPTRIGLAAGLVAVAIVGAAVNTGNNLLYLLSSLMLTALPVSAVLARRVLRQVRVGLLLPEETTAGDRAAAGLRVRAGQAGAAGLRLVPVDAEAEAATVPWLEPGATAVRKLELETRRRGPLPVRLRIECLFPWGLLVGRVEGPSGELLVLPRPVAGAEAPRTLAAAVEGRESLRPGRSQDLLEIRDYRPGDDARAIDWKATARRERPMVRQGTQEQDSRVAIVVDPARPGGERAPADEAVELAISRAAGAVRELRGAGRQVRLVLPGGESRGAERDQLRALARLETPETPPAAGWWRARLAPGEPFVLCSSREAP